MHQPLTNLATMLEIDMRKILTIALLLLAAVALIAGIVRSAGTDSPAPPPVTEADLSQPERLVLTYFHRDKRCDGCNALEASTVAAADSAFAEAKAADEFVFRSLSLDTPEHQHFINDFGITHNTVVLSLQRGEQVLRFVRLDECWDRATREDYAAWLAEHATALRAGGGA